MTVTNATTPAASDTADRLDPALLKLAGIVLVGAVAVQLDATIVSVAIDTLGRDLHAGLSTIQWVSTGYLLALALVIPLTGWSVDRFGSKRMWMLSLALFLGGSVLCGSAWSARSLIAFRVVQGIGGGMLLPLLQTILAQAAGPQRLGRLIAAIAVPALVAPIVGPVIGGLILEQRELALDLLRQRPRLRDRAGARVAVHARPASTRRASAGLPRTGAALSRACRDRLRLLRGRNPRRVRRSCGDRPADDRGRRWSWPSRCTRCETIEPIIDLRLFRQRSFAAAASLMFLAGLSVFGAMLLLPLYYQQVRGQSALDAGLLLAPQGLGLMIALPIVGRLTDRIGPRPIVLVGMALATLGTIPYTQVGVDTNELALGAALVIRGAGLGALFVPATTAAYHGLRNEAIPRATSAVRIFQQVGGSFGTAVLAVILQRHAASQAAAGPAGLATAFGHTFWWTVGFSALAFIPALFLPAERPQQASRADVAAEAPRAPMRPDSGLARLAETAAARDAEPADTPS